MNEIKTPREAPGCFLFFVEVLVDLGDEAVYILETAVHRRKANVGNLIQRLNPLHHQGE